MSYYISRTLRSGLAAIAINAGFEVVVAAGGVGGLGGGGSGGQGGRIRRRGEAGTAASRYGPHGRHAAVHQEELIKLCDTYYREKVLKESIGTWTRRARTPG